MLIASEIVTELGVDVSEKCSLKERKGVVIDKGGVKGFVTQVERGASAFFLQNIKFLDGNLTAVTAGTPVKLTENVCLQCLSPPKNPFIVANCNITHGRIYAPGELQASVQTTNGPFSTISVGFRRNGIQVLDGDISGDLTHNGNDYEIFSFYNSTDNSGLPVVHYLTYNHEVHVSALLKEARRFRTKDGPGKVLWESTRAPVRSYKIRCSINKLSSSQFRDALQVYRSMQLENTINPIRFNKLRGEGFYDIMTADDVSRAVLSTKIMDDEPKVGEYLVYERCAMYHWRFILPFALSLTVIVSLGIVSKYQSSAEFVRRIPYNSASWFQEAHRVRQDQMNRTRGAGDSDRGVIGGLFERGMRWLCGSSDEMVLVRDGTQQRIDLHRMQVQEEIVVRDVGSGDRWNVMDRVYEQGFPEENYPEWPGTHYPDRSGTQTTDCEVNLDILSGSSDRVQDTG